jgi:alpha-ketoglutarate-dependent taurine dioxygenase
MPDVVHARSLRENGALPLLVEPSAGGVDLAAWLDAHRERVNGWLVAHGAILFRGFGIDSPERFHAVAAACSRDLMVYKERSSPRTLVREHVYTSTDYPPDQQIFPHNEHSYASRFPMRLLFCCVVPARTGGETPLVDCRRVLQRVPPEIRARFDERGGWMYVRNFNESVGLSWQTVYQTTERSEVEEYCRRNDIRCEWSSDGRLRTIQVRPVVARHPVSGDEVWFNHATFFHVGTLPQELRDGLLQIFDPADLPNNTYYGDGTALEPETLAALQEAYTAEQVSFPWERGDVTLLDNMFTAHGRSAYSGERRVLVAMADPIDRSTLAA